MWSWIWGSWLGITVVVEVYTLITNYRNSLSETIWKWGSIQEGSGITHWTVVHFLIAAIMVWLFGHFVFHWWFR